MGKGEGCEGKGDDQGELNNFICSPEAAGAPRHSWAAARAVANEASARADRRHLLPLPPPAELLAALPGLPRSQVCPPVPLLQPPGVPEGRDSSVEHPRDGWLRMENLLCREGAGTFAPKHPRVPL